LEMRVRELIEKIAISSYTVGKKRKKGCRRKG